MMLVLIFNKSHSKKYKEAIKLSMAFDYEFSIVNKVRITVKDIFEKWEFFNSLFWLTVDWKGTYIEYNGMNYHSHCDKTLIFYSLQQAHSNWRNCTSHQLVQSYKVYKGNITQEMLERESLTDEQVNSIIDDYNIKKNQNK